MPPKSKPGLIWIAPVLSLPACSRPAPFMYELDVPAPKPENSKPKPQQSSAYKVIRKDGDHAKETFYVRLAQKVTTEKLRDISLEIKASRGGKRPRTIIWSCLPHQRCPQESWAFVDMDPDPKIELRGLSIENEKTLLALPLPPYTELLGVWLYDSEGARRYAIYRTADGFFMSQSRGGEMQPHAGEELIEEPGSGSDRQFRIKDRPRSTDRYLVLANGTSSSGTGRGSF